MRTSEDFDVPNSLNYHNKALNIYRLNKNVDNRNDFMLKRLASKDDQYFIDVKTKVND